MNPIQYYIAVILGVISLSLTVVVACYTQSNQQIQNQVQNRQVELNQGSTAQQLATNILQDVAVASLKNQKLKDLLTKNGYTVTVNNPTATPSPADSPAASKPGQP